MIGNNSCGTHSLLAGKTVDNVHELRILLYDGTELTVGAHLGSRARCDRPRGRAPRRDLRRAAILRDRYASPDSQPLSRRFPGGYRATTSTAAARERLSRGSCAGRLRRHVRDRARGHAAPDRQPPASHARRARLPRRVCGRRSRSRRFSSSIPSGSRASKAASSTGSSTRARPISNCFRPAGASCSSSSARTTPRESRAAAAPAHRNALAVSPVRQRRGSTRSRKRGLCGRFASPGHAPPPPFPARLPAGRDGTTRRSRPIGSGRTSATFARCWTNTNTRRRSTATSATAAFTCR